MKNSFLLILKIENSLKREKSQRKMKTPDSLCDGGWSAKDCTLIKAFLFWNSNRKRWKHQLLVWFSAPALSEGSLSHAALSFILLVFTNLILMVFAPILQSPPCRIPGEIISTKIFQQHKRNSELRRETVCSPKPCLLIVNANIYLYYALKTLFHLIILCTEKEGHIIKMLIKANFQAAKSKSSFLYQK